MAGKVAPQTEEYVHLPLVRVAEGIGLTPALVEMLAVLGVKLGPEESTVHWRITVDIRKPHACPTCAGRGTWNVTDAAGAWHSIPCPKCSAMDEPALEP